MRKVAASLALLAVLCGAQSAEEAPTEKPRPREEMREKLKSLPPAERRQRLDEWRKEQQARRQKWHSLSDDERQMKRKDLRERFQSQREKLRAKKAQGTLTPEEERRLRHFETLAKRFAAAPK